MADSRRQREWKESPYDQGEDEQIPYQWTCPTTWGTGPFTNCSATIKQLDTDGTWRASGTATLTGTLTGNSTGVFSGITVSSLEEGEQYKLEYRGDPSGGGRIESFCIIDCTV